MKYSTLLVILLFALSLFGGICVGMLVATNRSNEPLAAETAQATPAPQTPTPMPIITTAPEAPVSVAEKYSVILTDNKIYIYKTFSDGSMQAVQEKDINARMLPREEYEKLFGGVSVDTLDEAKELVEDYIS